MRTIAEFKYKSMGMERPKRLNFADQIAEVNIMQRNLAEDPSGKLMTVVTERKENYICLG